MCSPIDNARLIREVEERPPLYNKNMKEYNDREVRDELWLEVCRNVITDMHLMERLEQERWVKEVKKRWKNMRDCFIKELNYQKNKRVKNLAKRRRYIYFQQLLFLLPMIQEPKGSPGGDEDNDNDEDDAQTRESTPEDLGGEERDERRRKTSQRSPSDGIDEDQTFLLSLVPSFRRFSQQQKLTAKIEFLQVVQKLMKKEDDD